MLYGSFIYLLLLVFVGRHCKRRTRFLLVALPFLLIAFLRYGIGADYFSYERIYNIIDPNNVAASFEKLPQIEGLYKNINLIAKIIGLNYHIFAGIIASSLILITLKWFQNNSPHFELSALLHFSILFIYWNLSAARQGIVVTLLLFIYFDEEYDFSPRTKAVWTIILFFMHPTAIIVPPIYIVAKFNWNKLMFYALLLIAPIFRGIIDLNQVERIFNILGLERFFKYIDYNSIKLISTPSFMRLAFIIFILFHYKSLVEKYPRSRTMINFSLLGLIMYFYLPTAMVVGTRVTIFGYYLILIIFPMVMSLYTIKELNTLVLFLLIGISALSFYNELSKLVDRSGYIHSIHRLNTETIFQENREHFDK